MVLDNFDEFAALGRPPQHKSGGIEVNSIPYIGSGPYCYANSFSMMFGDASPSTSIIEFATSSAFGMQLIGGTTPFFDPYGWTPEAGFTDALAAMGKALNQTCHE